MRKRSKVSQRIVLLAILSVGVSFFGSRLAAALETVCNSAAAPGTVDLVKTFTGYNDMISELIVGDYFKNIFRSTCELKSTLADGSVATCSMTLLATPGKFSTAGHCGDPATTRTARCLCGRDKKTNQEVFTTATVGKIVVNPSYAATRAVEMQGMGNDLAIGELKNKLACPAPFLSPVGMPIPKNLIEARALVTRGDCYFSGVGMDNVDGMGALHAVQVPTNFHFAKYEFKYQNRTYKNETLFYVNMTAIHDMMAFAESDYAGEDSTVRTQNLNLFKTYFGARIEPDLALAVKDPKRQNAYRPGDSGGSLICRGEDRHLYLVGVLATAAQSVTLLNDPENANWLATQLK